jgi:hypothetical protein
MSAPLLPDFMRLFREFDAPSWDGWRAILGRLTPAVREFWAAVGRGAGKSRIVGLIAAAFACREYHLAAGEHVYVGIFAPDRKQAGITFRYIVGLMQSVPELAALIVRETKDSLELSNGVIVEVLSATTAAPRGRSYALAILEEAAFLPSDQSANPDTELLRAVRPALARVPGSLLCVVSSPYARRGILWDAWRKYHDQPDGDVVFVQAATADLNPAFDTREIARAYEEDPSAAAAEYGGQFRTDVETFIDPDAIAACVIPGRHEWSYRGSSTRYAAFLDAASGSGGDSMTLAIAHEDPRTSGSVVVLDLVREVRPPFSPKDVCASFAAELQCYGLYTATADRWGGEFVREAMSAHGITVYQSARSKSELYGELLPMINSRQVELVDAPVLIKQLLTLERRTARGGRDSIDHAPGAHDDVANVVAGVCVELLRPWGMAAPDERPTPAVSVTWLDVFGKAGWEARQRGELPPQPPPVVPSLTVGKCVMDDDPIARSWEAERKRAARGNR